MFKPLLKSIPSLSGNMKIVCKLEGYDVDSSNRNLYNCNVNNAYLTSISSNIYDKNIPLNLKNNSFEYDVKKFYLYYADVFYKNNFSYSKVNIPIIDFTTTINDSNIDFKFGCKRVSYLKSGNTLAFYSPIYVEGEEDIQGKYFVITCIFNKVYQLKKQIKIKISNINEGNSLADYLVRYASKLDDRVINCSNSYKNIYYGISLKNGGFVKIEDNISSNLYNKYYTINDFDATLNKGFQRNYMMMKQIIPLSFYFDPNNLLNNFEKNIYKNAEIIIKGQWYDENDQLIDFYDFSDDYSKFEEDIYNLYYEDEFRYLTTENNIMDLKYPACNEASSENYKYVNTVAKNYNRWKLKYSNDDYPYIINNNYAFSYNQGSLYTYKEFPFLYSPMRAFAKLVSNTEYNLLFDYDDIYDDEHTTIINNKSKYFDLYNKNFISNFFDLFNSNIFKEEIWSNVNKDGKVYHKGILYDLNTIYNENLSMDYKIDKFSVFVNPNFEYTLAKDFNNKYKICKNVFTYDFSYLGEENKEYNIDGLFNYYNLISKTSYLNNYQIVQKDPNGQYVDITEYLLNSGMNQYDKCQNVYLDANDIYINNLLINKKNIKLSDPLIVNNKEITLNIIEGYKVIDVYNLNNIFSSYFNKLKIDFKQINKKIIDNSIFRNQKYIEMESIYWAKDKLYFSIYPNKTKYSLIDNYKLLETIDENTRIVLYLKTDFIRYDNDLIDYLSYYQISEDDTAYFEQYGYYIKYRKYLFSNGLYDNKNKILYTSQIFRELNSLTDNYGQYFEENNIDNNFIYVDPYNLVKLYNTYGLDYDIQEDSFKEYYCNFLNMSHIRLYFEKLYKDENLNGTLSINDIYVKVRNFNNIAIKLNDDVNTDFSTILIQDDFISIKDLGIESIEDISLYIKYDETNKYFMFNQNYFNKFIKIYQETYDDPLFQRNGNEDEEDIYELIKNFNDKLKSLRINENEYKKYHRVVSTLGIYNIEHFQICFKKKMTLLNKDLYNLIIHRENNQIFKDLYLYHIEDPKQYSCQMNYFEHKNIIFDKSDKESVDKTIYVDHMQTMFSLLNDNNIYLYDELSNFNDFEKIDNQNNITSSLEPYFNSVYNENMEDTKIYSDYFINNIIQTTNGTDIRYRYNEPSIDMLAYVGNDNSFNGTRYSLVNSIDDSFMTASEFMQYNYDEDQIEEVKDQFNEYSNLITYNYNGTYYGFYIINSYFDNTNNTINIQNEDLAYINCVDFINNIHVSYLYPSYITNIYKNMLPYMNTSNPTKFILNNINTIIKPQIYKLKNNIKQYPNSDLSGSYSYTLYLTQKDSYIELSRYFDDIVPYIPKIQYNSSYFLYYKDTNKFIEHDLDLNRQAYIMYKGHINLNKFSYISYFDINNNVKKYEPTEYKYYNSNKYFNLEKEIIISLNQEFTEQELIDYENNDENIFKLFVNYIDNTKFNGLPNKDKINNYLFLYKKYEVKFIKDFKYINSSNNRIYSLTIKFNLL